MTDRMEAAMQSLRDGTWRGRALCILAATPCECIGYIADEFRKGQYKVRIDLGKGPHLFNVHTCDLEPILPAESPIVEEPE